MTSTAPSPTPFTAPRLKRMTFVAAAFSADLLALFPLSALPAPAAKADGAGKADKGNNARRSAEKAAATKVIRFSLGAVKGVGEGAVEVIKAARDQGGGFL